MLILHVCLSPPDSNSNESIRGGGTGPHTGRVLQSLGSTGPNPWLGPAPHRPERSAGVRQAPSWCLCVWVWVFWGGGASVCLVLRAPAGRPGEPDAEPTSGATGPGLHNLQVTETGCHAAPRLPRHWGSHGMWHDWGGPAPLDCHTAQVVLPESAGPTSRSAGST